MFVYFSNKPNTEMHLKSAYFAVFKYDITITKVYVYAKRNIFFYKCKITMKAKTQIPMIYN